MTTAIVPFRCPWHGKSRLRQHLPGAICDALSFAMYSDVVTALTASDVRRVVTLTHGVCGVRAAEDVDSEWKVHPADAGLNGALSWMLRQVQGQALIVAADLPALRPTTVDGLLAHPADIVIGPTQDGGTALLRLAHSRVLRLAYGKESARNHAIAAQDAGLSVDIRPQDCEHHDVDTFEDVLAAVGKRTQLGSATRDVFSVIAARHDVRSAARKPRC